MRRKDRERDKQFALEVLRDCEYATLATLNADKTPYCIPISPVLIYEAIYFHSATEGKKLDNIRENSAVCISGVRYTKLIPEKFTAHYESAVATGKCETVTNDDEKITALRAICDKYAKEVGGSDGQIEQLLHRTGICKVQIEHITGKANMPEN